MRRIALILGLMLLAVPAARAVQPDEILPNPALEQRARAISGGLRCLVCQNQSIDDSDAPLARDLRILVRERLVAGDSFTVPPDAVHGAVNIEAGILVDVFTPMRRDFVR